ncbi:MAG: flagellar basal body rod protein FlgB [Holosporales bacterium]
MVMDLKKVNVFQAITARMHYESKNQEVLADNIARAPIPGAQEKRLQPFSLHMRAGELAKTHPKHLGGGEKGGAYKVSNTRDTAQSLNGNNIEPQEQLQRLNESSVRYNEMASLYNSFASRARLIARMGK